jgi:general secretion pathway protein F
MPDFRYAARAADGRTTTGTLAAATRKAALQELHRRGLVPHHLAEPGSAALSASAGAAPAAAAPPARLTERQLTVFWTNLLQLTAGGMSAGESVRLLGTRMEDARLRQLAGRLWARLSEGDLLSAALASQPGLIDRESIQLVRAGESTGHLGEALARIHQLRAERAELRRKLIEALAYPLFVCGAAGAVVLLFIFFLLPRIEQLLTGLGSQLPWATRLLVGVSRSAAYAALPALLVVIALGLLFWRWRATPAGRAKCDELSLRLPLVGPGLLDAATMQMFQTLAGLLENGIPLADALHTATEGVGNSSLRLRLRRSIEHLLEGRSLAAAFRETRLFPPLVTDRLAAGEEAGRLAAGLRELGREQQAAWSERMRWLTQLFSIAILLLTFVLVGFVAWAIVSAVFQVSSSLRA